MVFLLIYYIAGTGVPFLVDGLRKRAYELFNLGQVRLSNTPLVTLIDRTRTRRFINKNEIIEMLSGLSTTPPFSSVV